MTARPHAPGDEVASASPSVPPSGGSLAACTIALSTELPQVRVLARSLSRHHPGSTLRVLLLDAPREFAEDPGDGQFISWPAAGFTEEEARQLPMLLAAEQLKALAKPVLLQTLLRASSAPVFYFDVDVYVVGVLDTASAMSTKHGIVAAPGPDLQMRGQFGAAATIAEAGVVAIAPAAISSVESWVARGRSEAGLDDGSARGPLALTGERVHLFDQPAWGLGFWNLRGRRLARTDGAYLVDGELLRCFQFSGYDPQKPHLLSRHQGIRPAVLLSDDPVLTELCERYREELLAAGWRGDSDPAHERLRFLPSGIRIDEHMRELYRMALERFHSRTGPEPQSPFGPGGERSFINWLNQSVDAGHGMVSRYMTAIHAARPDLQTAFPDFLDNDAPAFRQWFLVHGPAELCLPQVLLGAGTVAEAVPPAALPVVTVAGYFNAELGIGEAARLLVEALEESGLRFSTVAYEGTANRQHHPFTHRAVQDGVPDINIVCVNADQFIPFLEKMGRSFSNGKYTIGVWFWEVDQFPSEFRAAFNYVDEIWVASEYARAALLKVCPKTVFKYPLPVILPETNPQLSRGHLDLPEGFSFLFSFDFLSVLERKNPLGLIEAFDRAFVPGEGPTLVLKTINGDQRILELEKLRFAARHRPDIRIVDGYLTEVEKNTLTALCDCYVSLHRAEGFGLTMAEAMAFGRPVIATGFSANLEFMNASNSYLCRFVETEVGPERQPYPADAIWAEPDVEHAAALMRHVYTNVDEARERGARAARDILQGRTPAVAARSIRERVEKIRGRLSGSRATSSAEILEDRIEALERIVHAQAQQIRTRSS